jgi:transposase InsO family protein
MSRRGNCLDKAPMESFSHTLKVERVHRQMCPTSDGRKLDLPRSHAWSNRSDARGSSR